MNTKNYALIKINIHLGNSNVHNVQKNEIFELNVTIQIYRLFEMVCYYDAEYPVIMHI